MKTFRTLVVTRQPLDRVWTVVRDRLPDLAMALDDVESIVVIEREVMASGDVRIVNEWRSRQRIPAGLGERFGATDLTWVDRNIWDDSDHCCTWCIEPAILKEQIRCNGTTRYEPAMGGRGTRVTCTGTFDLDPGALAAFAGPVRGPISAFAESIATTLVPRNVRRVIEAAALLVDAESREPCPAGTSAEQNAVVEA